VRIIAGELKGREIVLPRGSRIRPATGYVRELAMNLYTPKRLEGAVFLDVCAGSGLVGFEALSRGARRTIFVEADRRTASQLRDTAEHFGVNERISIIAIDARRCFATLRNALGGQLVDAVFLDPPYIPGMAVDLLYRFGTVTDLLAPDGLLMLRTPDQLPEEIPGLQFAEKRHAGNGALWLYYPARIDHTEQEGCGGG
jgi:16S rRNA (guanine966-N2)-methyltransferase